MKNILGLFIVVSASIGCNSNGDPSKEISKQDSIPPVSTTDTARSNPAVVVTEFSTKDIVANYLTLKNALTKDDSKGAASAGTAIADNLKGVDTSKLSDAQKKTFLDVSEDAKEHAEHIGANADKLAHQREHFAMLSKDVNDLINAFGADQKLYQDFCPMYNNGKGAIWISESKEIRNPYYGSKMLTCGSVKKEW